MTPATGEGVKAKSKGWGDGAAALAEADARKALAAAVRAHDHGVAVFEEAAVSPDGSASGSRPPAEISSKLPSPSSLGVETVPVPNKSPARRLQPPLLWCVTNWATVR